MHRVHTFLISLAVVVAPLACSDPPPDEEATTTEANPRDVRAGDYYYSSEDKGEFFVSQVLAARGGEVFIRSYGNVFSEPPTQADVGDLRLHLDPFSSPPEGDVLGVPCLLMYVDEFLEGNHFICRGEVPKITDEPTMIMLKFYQAEPKTNG